MSFDSVTFWLFFLVAWTLWRRLPFAQAKTAALLLSLVFYGWWNPLYLPLIATSAGIDFVAARRLHGATTTAARRGWLLLSLATNLGLLGFFKYAPFVAENARALFALFDLSLDVDTAGWVIPVGISFYTFQTLSYSLDVYHRRLEPVQSFRDFFLFVAFFPQLVAGPIVRAGELLPQLRRRRSLRIEAVQAGLEQIVTGLFLKIVVADNLGPAVGRVFDEGALPGLSPLAAWVGVACFSVQIFADFAGYSGIAIGMARLMGLRFPRNFDWPYASRGPSEFWSRWHISLSTWLRDYLYVPLGGNRGSGRAVLRNLMITMLLGGLWHGPAWTFVAWGGLHGLGLCVERLVRGDRRPRRPGGPLRGPGDLARRLAQIAMLNVFVLVTWVFFRAEGFGMALALLERMFVAPFREPVGWADLASARHLSLVLVVVAMHLACLAREWGGLKASRNARAVAVGAGLFLLTVVRREAIQEFIYFQF